MNRRRLAIANWKMNYGIGETIKYVTELTRSTLPESIDIVICPPFTSLYTLSVALGDSEQVKIGAQNCFYQDNGPFTGEVSVEFLKEVNCQYVIVGHSERRHLFHEDDRLISKKLGEVVHYGLNPVFCVGEMENDRDAGKTFEVIAHQLEEGLKNFEKDQISQTVIAYEPVWAIGSGKNATPGQAQEVHSFIRKWAGKKFGTSYAGEMRIVYGGSVKPDNVGPFMTQEDIDGVLVGGSSLKPKEFLDIISRCR